MHDSSSKLTYSKAFAFASPSLALALLMAPIGLLPSIFAKYYGVSLVALGGILLFIRAFDSITDVLIGHFSDRYRLRHGTRKPFVIMGGLLSLPCAYFLVSPPSGEVTVVTFAFWSVLYYLCFTLFNIPKFAWAGELTTVPEDRTFIFSVLAFVSRIAALLFYMIPFLPLFATREITPEVLKFSVVCGMFVMLPTLYLLARYVPSGIPPSAKESVVKSHAAAFKDYLTIFVTNKPFQVFMAAYVFYGLGLGMYGGLLFLYIDVFLGLGDQYATIAIIGLVGALVLTPLGYKLAVSLGKRVNWIISTILVIGGIFYTATLSPGHAGLVDLIIMKMIFVVASITLAIVGPAMLNDTIDYGLLQKESGARGVYLALYTFMVKIEVALGASLGLALAGWLGFQATEPTQTAQGAFAIRFTMCWVPMVIIGLGLYFIHKTPLNEARTAIIGRRLEKRARRNSINSNSNKLLIAS